MFIPDDNNNNNNKHYYSTYECCWILVLNVFNQNVCFMMYRKYFSLPSYYVTSCCMHGIFFNHMGSLSSALNSNHSLHPVLQSYCVVYTANPTVIILCFMLNLRFLQLPLLLNTIKIIIIIIIVSCCNIQGGSL